MLTSKVELQYTTAVRFFGFFSACKPINFLSLTTNIIVSSPACLLLMPFAHIIVCLADALLMWRVDKSGFTPEGRQLSSQGAGLLAAESSGSELAKIFRWLSSARNSATRAFKK
uniref:Uncharacterized protein n=1 Tax=Trypanosoma congolense (strain IL3000) TaxID=1068625 RepID=G0URS3_TRYCI|nr:hypothetical protein, unlikely [Trypanosoma congolense IL3000]